MWRGVDDWRLELNLINSVKYATDAPLEPSTLAPAGRMPVAGPFSVGNGPVGLQKFLTLAWSTLYGATFDSGFV